MSQMLQNLKDSFLKKFAGTFQLFLDKYFGDYLADASQLKLESLVTGVKNLKLNKDFINGVLGSSILTLTSASIGKNKLEPRLSPRQQTKTSGQWHSFRLPSGLKNQQGRSSETLSEKTRDPTSGNAQTRVTL